jgi:hypothetical protein
MPVLSKLRPRLLFAISSVLLLALVYFVATRSRDPHVMPAPKVAPPETPDAGPDAAPSPAASNALEAGAVAVASADAALVAAAPDAGMLDRPLRVVASSWDGAAALAAANGGLVTADGSAARAAGIDLAVVVPGNRKGPREEQAEPYEREVERRFARGGEDEGADVAILPLPYLVRAYERLRALEPQVIYVVGWPRGSYRLLGGRDGMLARPRAAEDVTLAASDDAAVALGLFALDEAGEPSSRVRVVSDAKGAAFAAAAGPAAPDPRPDVPAKLLLSTWDAPRLVPLVAVVARPFADKHAAALAALVRVWVDGAVAMRKDVPAAARRLAAEAGAPELPELLALLGDMEDAAPADEARWLGASDAATVGSLFGRFWKLWRDAAAITSAAPPEAPVNSAPVGRLLTAQPKLAEPRALPFTAPDPKARVLVAHRLDKADADAAAAEAAWLAGIFVRSAVRVSARPPSVARDAAAIAHDKLGVASERVIVGGAPAADGGPALVEVLAAP